MNDPRRRTPHQYGPISGTVESLLTAAAVVLMLASIACMAVLVTTAFAAPRVGDLVVFKPGVQVAGELTFPVHRLGQATQSACELNPEIMTQSGGSLVVESRSIANATYDVHWAGGHTAAGALDCGTTADLTMQKGDLERLVNAMGGRGIAGRGYVF